MKPREDLFSFATDLARTQALVLSKPVQLFGIPSIPNPNLSAALIDELVLEGKMRKRKPNHHDD